MPSANRYFALSILDSTQQKMLDRMLPLKQVTSFIKRGANIKLDANGKIPVIGPAAIRAMILDTHGMGQTTEDGLPPQSLTVQPGDVLLNNIGIYLGNAAVVSEDLEGSYISRHVILIRPDAAQILPAYLAAAINSNYVQTQIQQRATGSVMPALTIGRLEEVTVPVPDFDIQREVIQKIENAQKNLIQAQENLSKAENIFTGLIQKLYNEE